MVLPWCCIDSILSLVTLQATSVVRFALKTTQELDGGYTLGFFSGN